MIVETLVKEIIKILLNPLFNAISKNFEVLNFLSQYKKLELKNGDFDSIYVHALIEFNSQKDNSKVLGFFADKDIINSYKCGDYLIPDKFKPNLDRALHTLKLLELKRYSYLDDFMPLVEEFTEIFRSLTLQSSSPILLKIYNEQKKTLKLILEDNQKKSKSYQIQQYITRTIKAYNTCFENGQLYIDMIGETKKEQKTFTKKYNLLTLDELAEFEEKEARPVFIKKVFDPIDEYIDNWLIINSSNILVILGEYGTGKTTLCRHLFAKYGALFLRENLNNRIPFFFPLRNFEYHLESFITSQLANENISSLNYVEFNEMASAGQFIVFFDGFDEMTQKIDTDEKKKNFQKLRNFAESNKSSKVIVTCRNEYFNSYEEIISIFKHRDTSIVSLLYVKPFNSNQISKFIRKHSKDPAIIEEKIKEIYDLADLAKRPVLLQLIVDYLPKILKSKGNDKVKIKSVDLYFTCINEELKRKDLNFILPNRYRLQILKNICLWLFHNSSLSFDIVTVGEDLELINYFKTNTPWEYEKYLNEFLTFTFLINDSKNTYRISHKSFRDYLVALELINEINIGSANHLIKSRISDEIKNFIIELEPNKDNLLKFIIDSKVLNSSQNWLGCNSATILLSIKSSSLKGKDLSYCDLRNVDFRQADITKTKFSNSNLSNCMFNSSILSCNYIGANFNEVYLDFNQQRIKDLNFLYDMPGIKTLSVWNNYISDLSPVSSQKNIKELFLWSNPITRKQLEIIRNEMPECKIEY